MNNDQDNNGMYPNQNNFQSNQMLENVLNEQGLESMYFNHLYFVSPFISFVMRTILPRRSNVPKFTNLLFG